MEKITKVCSHCRRELPITEFYRNKCLKDGYDHYCKECKKQYYRNEEHREKMREYFKEYRKTEKWKNYVQSEANKDRLKRYRESEKYLEYKSTHPYGSGTREGRNARMNEHTKKLSDYYVRRQLIERGCNPNDITPEMIENKRQQLMDFRAKHKRIA